MAGEADLSGTINDPNEVPEAAKRPSGRRPEPSELFEVMDGVFVASVTTGAKRSATPVPRRSALAAGRPFGRFYLERKLGEFEEGEIWRARETGERARGRGCVLKTVTAGLAMQGSVRRERFIREARVGRLVRHPHIVEIFDCGEHDGIAYLAREHIEGQSLAELAMHARQSMSSLPLVVALGYRIADALAYAHNRTDRGGALLHLVHGELAPTSVLLDEDGTPKLSELTLSRLDGRALSPRRESRLGKLGYMAPEQMKGRPIDARTDLFALGVIMVELLGRDSLPWDGNLALDDIPDIVVEWCTGRGDVPPKLMAMLIRMTALESTARPADASEVADALQSLLPSVGGQRLMLEHELARVMHFGDEAPTDDALEPHFDDEPSAPLVSPVLTIQDDEERRAEDLATDHAALLASLPPTALTDDPVTLHDYDGATAEDEPSGGGFGTRIPEAETLQEEQLAEAPRPPSFASILVEQSDLQALDDEAETVGPRESSAAEATTDEHESSDLPTPPESAEAQQAAVDDAVRSWTEESETAADLSSAQAPPPLESEAHVMAIPPSAETSVERPSGEPVEDVDVVAAEDVDAAVTVRPVGAEVPEPDAWGPTTLDPPERVSETLLDSTSSDLDPEELEDMSEFMMELEASSPGIARQVDALEARRPSVFDEPTSRADAESGDDVEPGALVATTEDGEESAPSAPDLQVAAEDPTPAGPMSDASEDAARRNAETAGSTDGQQRAEPPETSPDFDALKPNVEGFGFAEPAKTTDDPMSAMDVDKPTAVSSDEPQLDEPPKTVVDVDALQLDGDPQTLLDADGLQLDGDPQTLSNADGLQLDADPQPLSNADGLQLEVGPKTSLDVDEPQLEEAPKSALDGDAEADPAEQSGGDGAPRVDQALDRATAALAEVEALLRETSVPRKRGREPPPQSKVRTPTPIAQAETELASLIPAEVTVRAQTPPPRGGDADEPLSPLEESVTPEPPQARASRARSKVRVQDASRGRGRTPRPKRERTAPPQAERTPPPKRERTVPPKAERTPPPKRERTVPPRVERTPPPKRERPPHIERTPPPKRERPATIEPTPKPTREPTWPPKAGRTPPPKAERTPPPEAERTPPPEAGRTSARSVPPEPPIQIVRGTAVAPPTDRGSGPDLSALPQVGPPLPGGSASGPPRGQWDHSPQTGSQGAIPVMPSTFGADDA